MDDKKKVSEAEHFIRTMLGENNMDIELTAEDYEVIETHTMDVIGPYYSGTKFIYGRGPVIDLSNYPEVISVHKIFESAADDNNDFMKTLFFGQPGVYIWDSSTMDNLLQYVALQHLYTNFKSIKSQTWKYIKPKCYVHGYSGGVILECFVRPTKFSDLDRDSASYGLAKQYALALAKEIVGRTRSRFTVAGAPYQLDGDRLLAEAQQEKADVISRIIPPIRVY